MPLNNVDYILEELMKRCKTVSKFEKLDGITLECTLKTRVTLEKAKQELQEICKELQILPISVEQNKEDKKLFALQFPELNVVYTDKELEILFTQWFEWLLRDSQLRNPDLKLTKQLLIESKDTYVKTAIQMFCRSNINPYKQNVDMFLNNTEFRKQVDMIYYTSIDKYCKEKGIF